MTPDLSAASCPVRRRRPRHRVPALAAAGLWPANAIASDYSGFIYIFGGVAVALILPIALVAYLVTKGTRSLVFRSIVWGTALALAAAPVGTLGGPGAASGTPIYNFVIYAFSGDPADAAGALRAFSISAPLLSALIAILAWGRPRPGCR